MEGEVSTMLKFLEEMNGELLVMGMHKRSGIGGWLGSSISEEHNFRSLLNIFEGQIKENGSQANIPSMFRQEACS